MHLKVYCIFPFILLLTIFINAQTKNGIVTGTIIDESDGKPLEFVNISLISIPDSIVFSGTSSDKKGKYTINNIPDGQYIIRFSFVGYQQKDSEIFLISLNNKFVNLGTTSIKPQDINLDEVTVTSNKIMLSNSIDKKTYNVQQDVLSKTGSASDLLQNIPSVEVDIDGNVSLRGSANVLMLINGKTSPLMGRTRAEVLQTIPANNIDKIEVITNPSAKYRPDGTAGIINIVLKKESGRGLNGSITGNMGNQSRYNSNINLGYNPGNLNLFGRYSIRKDNRDRYSGSNRTQLDSLTQIPKFYNSNSNSNSRPLSHSIMIGMDYNFNNSNSLGLAGNYFYRDFTLNENMENVYLNNNNILTEKYNRLRTDYEYEKEGVVTAYLEHNFTGEEHKIRFNFNWSKNPESEDNHYSNVYTVPSGATTMDNTLIKQGSNNTQATLEYSNPLNEHSTFEAGYDGEFNKKDLNFFGEFFDPLSQKFVNDAEKTNHFAYDENINAVYATYSNEYGELGFLGGLRLENAQLNSNLISSGKLYKNQYFNLYPTLHLAYKLNDVTELQLNYSRRANRPEDDDLNPFPEYQDPRNLRAGNPNLKPEFIHSIEFGFQWQNDNFNIVPSIFYRHKYNGFSIVTKAINDSVLLTTHENLATDQSAGFEFVLSSNFGNYLSANLSTNAYYEQINASNIGFGKNKSTITWSGNFSCNANLTQSTMFQLNSNYRSSRLTPQGNRKPNYVVNLGIRQDMLNDKISLILTISDIFNSMKWEDNINTSWLIQNSIRTRSARIVYLGITYHFGKTKKSKEKSLQYDNGM